MKSFETVWAYMQSNLRADVEIDNWTAYRGKLGDRMRVTGVRDGFIEVDPPKAINLQVVPKDDFERVWKVWEVYKNQTVKRNELKPVTRFSKYIISILHWYEENGK